MFGSAPVFELSWIQLMQNVNANRIRNHLKKIDRARRSSYTYNNVQDIRPSLESQHLQAVLIRAVLTLLLWEEQHVRMIHQNSLLVEVQRVEKLRNLEVKIILMDLCRWIR